MGVIGFGLPLYDISTLARVPQRQMTDSQRQPRVESDHRSRSAKWISQLEPRNEILRE